MLSTMFNSTAIPLLEQVVNFTEARHGVLAGNIANVDTPGYKTRDLSPELFQAHLKTAAEVRRASQSLSPGHGSNYSSRNLVQDSKQRYESLAHVKDSLESILRHDEVNVSLEEQINQIVKNQTEHNLAVGIMTAQMRLLRAAISERVA